MTTIKLAKWGNSVGLRLPKHVLEGLGLEAGSFVNVTLDSEGVCFRPVKKYSLDKLVSDITADNIHGETDWGIEAGKEQW